MSPPSVTGKLKQVNFSEELTMITRRSVKTNGRYIVPRMLVAPAFARLSRFILPSKRVVLF